MLSALVVSACSDTFYFVIVTALMFISSLPSPWFRNPNLTCPRYYRWFVTSLLLLASLYTLAGTDLKMTSLKALAHNLNIILHTADYFFSLVFLFRREKRMQCIIEELHQSHVELGYPTKRINNTSRFLILLVVLVKALQFSDMMVSQYHESRHFLLSILRAGMACEWIIFTSLNTHGFSQLCCMVQSVPSRAQTRLLQRGCVTVLLEKFRQNSQIHRETVCCFRSMLLLRSSVTTFLVFKNIFDVWRVIDQVPMVQLLSLVVQLLDSTIILIVLSVTGSAVVNEVEELKYKIDKILTFDPPKYIRQHLKVFAMEVEVTDFSVSPFGLYTIDVKMASTIAGTLVSYMIIMTQLNEY